MNEEKKLNLHDIVKHKHYKDTDLFLIYNINILNNTTEYDIRNINPPNRKLLFQSGNQLTFVRMANPDEKNKNNQSEEFNHNKSVVVFITLNLHGSVIINNNNTLDVQPYPFNFNDIFWKNKGICGKLSYYGSPTEDNGITPESTHKVFAKSIQKQTLESDMEHHIYCEDLFYYNEHRYRNCKKNPCEYINQDQFYEQKDNNYVCTEKYRGLLNTPHTNTTRYVNKHLSFEGIKPEQGIFISIIDEDKIETIHSKDTAELNNVVQFINNFIQIKSNHKVELDTSEIESIQNSISTNLTLYNVFRIFELLDKINYDVDLYLLDYSCSIFNKNVKLKDTNYDKVMDDTTIAKGGNLRFKRRKNKTKRRKISKKMKIKQKRVNKTRKSVL
jgi:hypothetical protein